MPVDGLSHPNIRFYYKGIKGLVAGEQSGLPAGTGTRRTANLLAVARTVAARDASALPAPLTGAEASVAGLPLAFGPEGWPDALVPDDDDRLAARLVHAALAHATARPFKASGFWTVLVDTARAVGPASRVTARMERLTDRLDRFPLDLAEACDGAGTYADEAVPFALAMFARNPDLVEATLLSAINAGGDTATVGALVGALLGARHGAEAFPAEWTDGLLARPDVQTAAEALGVADTRRETTDVLVDRQKADNPLGR